MASKFLGIIAGLKHHIGCMIMTCRHAKSLHSCLTLCDPMDCSLPGSSVHEILQTRILEWVAMPSSRVSSQPKDQTCISWGSYIAGGFLTLESSGTHMIINQLLLSRFKLCLTLCDPTDSSPSGSAVPGILQARTLEWVAISFSSAWKWKVKVKSHSRVQLLGTPWTAAYQAPLSMGFSSQEYWSGLPLPSPMKSATNV